MVCLSHSKYTLLLPLVLLLLAAGCDSPSDIDTPRSRTVENGGSGRLPASVILRIHPLNTAGGLLYTPRDIKAEIDTASERIWIEGTWIQPAGNTPLDFPIDRLILHLDSCPVQGTPMSVLGTEGVGKGTSVFVYDNPSNGSPTELIPDDSPNNSMSLSYVWDTNSRTVEGQLSITVLQSGRSVLCNGELILTY